jgi:hypothetical protein
MPLRNKFNLGRFAGVLFLFVVSAFTYLPNLIRATIYRDDWYYAMDRLIGGAGIFQAMFSVDRPIRGPLFEIYYQLFGIQPLPYHLASFLWRFLGGLAALWLFNMLWPRQRRAALFMALLFTLFPGYTRWMEGFENQPRILSSFLEVFSIALTIEAIKTSSLAPKIAAWIGSILLGWVYTALVDFSVGMELFRLLCVFVLVSHDQQNLSFIKKAVLAIRAWAIAVVIPVGFLFWKLFIFHGERKQTDIATQLGYLITSPVHIGSLWLTHLFQSAANVAFLSWGAAPFQSLFSLSLRDVAIGILLAVIPVAAVFFSNRILYKENDDQKNVPDSSSPNAWQVEAIWIGLIGVIAGVLPVVMANRYVNFTAFSHYALPASLAGAVFIGGLVYSILSSRIRLSVVSALVLSAVLTHYAISTRVVNEQDTISAFWQQVAWRAPDIKKGTTLIVNYPNLDLGDAVDAVMGPANFIYYPEQTNQIPATYPLYSMLPTKYTIQDIIVSQNRGDGYRTHVGEINYDRLLVISQPSDTACAHVIDQRWPLFSEVESPQIVLAATRSKVENILTDKESPKLAEFLFGLEPAHQWCFYFEKADLALQTGDWEKVAKLGDEAIESGFQPGDLVEWTPFLQAYAYLGNEQAFKELVGKMKSSSFASLQACDTLIKMQNSGFSFNDQIQDQMNRICNGR